MSKACGRLDGVPDLAVIDEGTLKGFVSINPMLPDVNYNFYIMFAAKPDEYQDPKTGETKKRQIKRKQKSIDNSLEDKILKEFPNQIAGLEQRIAGLEVDMKTVSEHPVGDAEHFCGMEVKFSAKNTKYEAQNSSATG